MDRNGNYITFAYDASNGLLSSITNQDNTPLLTIHRVTDGTGNIAWVQDCYGRAVFYHVGIYQNLNIGMPWPQSYQELDRVSQVVPVTPSSPTLPDRYVLGYQLLADGEGKEQVAFLHTIIVPSPKADETLATASINYDPDTDFVSSLVDGNGNVSSFQSVNASGQPSYPSNYTKVTITDALGNVAYSYLSSYDNNMNSLGETDGTGRPTSYPVYSDPNDPYNPSSVKDGNGNQTSSTWDAYGNLLTETSPRGVTTTYTYDYSHFALGELTSVQEGTKTATTYAYDHADGYVDGTGTFVPCGLVTSIQSPKPGSASGSGSQVTTRFTYDVTGQGSQAMGSLGLSNILTVTTPGNNATLVGGVDQGITTTFAYTGERSKLMGYN